MVNITKQILVYSDSLTWGIIPNTRKRLPFEKRWTGVFENALNTKDSNVRVIENCLNGRRTVWSDPYKEGRDGSQGLAQVIEINSPLKLVILMSGTNDFQCTHDNNAWLSAQGTAKLINIIRQAPIEPEMPVPEIMVIAPPKIIDRGVAIFAKACFGHPSPSKRQKLNATTNAFGAPDVPRTCHFATPS